MLEGRSVVATIPAADLERAKRFYEDKLGLTPAREVAGYARYRSGSSEFDLYPTEHAGTAQHTLVGWEVDDIEEVVEHLRARGVVFEEYDVPGLTTRNGIADLNGERLAWFRDSEGNILAISQPLPASVLEAAEAQR